jgi:hypothetical protein
LAASFINRQLKVRHVLEGSLERGARSLPVTSEARLLAPRLHSPLDHLVCDLHCNSLSQPDTLAIKRVTAHKVPIFHREHRLRRADADSQHQL